MRQSFASESEKWNFRSKGPRLGHPAAALRAQRRASGADGVQHIDKQIATAEASKVASTLAQQLRAKTAERGSTQVLPGLMDDLTVTA